MGSRSAIALDLGRWELRALLATRMRTSLAVRQVLVAPVPETLDIDNPEAAGKWIAERLREAKFPRVGATVAISRERVVLKRLTLPTAEPDELPEMIRLAMQRELPFAAESAVIDFVPLTREDASTTVLAVAIAEATVEAAWRMVRAAGLSLERIALRTMGSAALIGSLGRPGGAGTLIVDVTAERVEFSVAVGSAVRFSRAAELNGRDDPESLADAVVTETRRTWLSYRIVEDSRDVSRAVVLGRRELGEPVAQPISEMLNVQTELLSEHPLIAPHGQAMDGAWPLAGLLLEPVLGLDMIDFAAPRQAPDIAARTRQRALLVAGLALVLLLGVFTAVRLHLIGLENDVAALEDRLAQLHPDYLRYVRDTYKLTHLEQWNQVQPAWLEHLARFAELAPPPDQLVLDSWSGTLAFDGAQFDRKTNTWQSPHEVRLMLDGEARDRAIADTLRGAIVETRSYRSTTVGPDGPGGRRLPQAFRYLLHASGASPSAGAPRKGGTIQDADLAAAPREDGR